MYVKYICRVSKDLKFMSFADNTNLLTAGEELHQVFELVMWEMKTIKTWCNINILYFNV